MLSGDSPERRPSFSQAHSDDDTEVYVRKEAQAPAAAPKPAPKIADEEVTLGGEDVEVTEPVRRANPDPGPFATFLNQPVPVKEAPANRPLPASTDDVEVYAGRQPKPEERIAATAETGQFLIAPSADDGTYSYPTKAKPKEEKPAPAAKSPNFQNTVDAIHQKKSTAESGAFLIPPSGGGGGGSSGEWYEYPSKPKEKSADPLTAKMVYRGPMSDDGSVLYEGKPREVPRADLERAKPTETGYDGTELYVGHKPTRSVQNVSHENFVLYGGKVETKPSIKPGPPTEGPNATKYYANPNAAPGNKIVERTSQFDVYESAPKAKEEAPPPVVRPSWQDGNAILYTSKDPSRRSQDKYPSLVNLKPDRGYDRSVSDANGFVLYEKPKAPREPQAPKPVGTSDPSNGYIYYEKQKPVAPVEPVASPMTAPIPEQAEPAPAVVAPPAPADEEDFEVYERTPPQPETVAAATLDVVEQVAPPTVVQAPPPEPMTAPLEWSLPAAESVAEPTPPPVVEQAEVVEAEPTTPPTIEMPELPLVEPPVAEVAPEPKPVVLEIIEAAEPEPIQPEQANLEPTPALTDLPTESRLEGVDIVDAPLEAPLPPLPLEFATGNMPVFPRDGTLPSHLPEIETSLPAASLPGAPATGLDREEPTPEYLPSGFTLEASARGSVDMRIAFVVSEFNYDITTMMLERAKSHAEFLGAKLGPVLHVPGTFDMGIAVKKLLGRKDVDGVVTLGAVIQGETDHDQVVLQHASRKIADLSIEFGKPVALGITGPGMTRLQAMERIDRAKDAVEAVVKLHARLKAIEAS